MSNQPTKQEGNGRLRVLIADDSAVTRRSTQLMVSLVPNAEVVAVAQDGRQAVELARTHQPDIALMDIQMPRMNGLQAIEAMLRTNKGLACIILSAEKDSKTLRQAILAGAKGYLIKPFTSQQFVEVVTRIIAEFPQSRANKTAASPPPPSVQKPAVSLTAIATAYIRNRRTDSKAVAVFEKLAANPQCDIRWLRHLAIIYVLRGEWHKLAQLAARLESQTSQDLHPSVKRQTDVRN